MKYRSAVAAFAVALLVGGIFGAATSLVNDVSSPYGTTGIQVVGTRFMWVAEVASKLLDSGWAWAGLAIFAGWLAGTSVRGAVAGVLALIAATFAYFVMDSVLWGGPSPLHWSEIRFWWLASGILGTPLGVVGANIRRPGIIGLFAKLTLPVGATVQMIWLANEPLGTDPALDWARMIVWVVAGVAVGAAITQFGVRLYMSLHGRPEQQ